MAVGTERNPFPYTCGLRVIQADFRVFIANVGAIGRFLRDLARAIIGFYQFLELMPDRVAEIDRAIAGGLHKSRLAVVLTKSFITKTDEALEGGEALHKRLVGISRLPN